MIPNEPDVIAIQIVPTIPAIIDGIDVISETTLNAICCDYPSVADGEGALNARELTIILSILPITLEANRNIIATPTSLNN